MTELFNTGTKKLFSTALMLILILSAAAAHGEEASSENRTVVAFGSSRADRDVSSSKTASVSQALLSAVRIAASELISAEDLRENFETLTELLDEKREDFIRDFRILEEFQGEKKHHVLLQATVSNRKIMEMLESEGIKEAREQMPSLLLMIAEKNMDDIDYEYWWRTGYSKFLNLSSVPPIKQIFTDNGYTLITPPSEGTKGMDLIEDINPDAEPADYEVSLIAGRLGADLVVTGKAEAKTTANSMGEDVRTFRGSVNLRVVDAQTGETLTTVREQSITVSKDQEKGGKNAMADAAYKAGNQLSGRIASIWRKGSEPENELTINIKGEPLLGQLEKLRNTLKQQSGVSELRTTEMTAKSAALVLNFEGSAQELADSLLVQSFDNFGVNISEVSPEGFVVELISK